jgi:hypothetical protein
MHPSHDQSPDDPPKRKLGWGDALPTEHPSLLVGAVSILVLAMALFFLFGGKRTWPFMIFAVVLAIVLIWVVLSFLPLVVHRRHAGRNTRTGENPTLDEGRRDDRSKLQ